MKKYKFDSKKIKTIYVSLLTLGVLFTGSVFASENPDGLEVRLSDKYLEWSELSDEEKKNYIMPNTFIPDVSDDVLNRYDIKDRPQLITALLGKTRATLDQPVGATASQSSYSLASDLNIRVEHQGITTECWAFSLIKSMETNIALHSNTRELGNFSERHMDYATSRTFLDGTNPDGFNREIGKGGLPIAGLAYLVNGQGAVLESDMPFQNSENRINLSEINKRVDTVVTDYVILPSVIKQYERDGSGNTTGVRYFKSSGEEYTSNELTNARQMIKEHIIKNGAVTTMTGGNYSEYYNNSDIFRATAYNCNNTSKVRDHAVTIVGWDDNYSRNNFREGAKPSTDGAYIVLNSYGTESFQNGYLYISYEDFFVEDELYGICGTSKVNYDTLYQHDFYGGIYQIGSRTQNTGYYATVFEKDNTQEEYLHSVGVTLPDYAGVDIYVNPSGRDASLDSLIYVGSSNGILSPGFHTINFNDIKVYGKEFTIVVKQTSDNGQFYFSVESSIAGTIYSDVKSSGLSYFSLDGKVWRNLQDTSIAGIEMKNADVCIKAYTTENPGSSYVPTDPTEPDEPTDPVDPVEPTDPTEPEKPTDPVDPVEPTDPTEPDEPTDPVDPVVDIFESTTYQISETDIMKIEGDTNIQSFLNNVSTNLEMTFMDNNVKITDNNIPIKTGMKLILSNGKEYTLIVRGDINFDGKLSLMDISGTVLHFNEAKGYELTGNAFKGADMNCDGRVSLMDISAMVMIFNAK